MQLKHMAASEHEALVSAKHIRPPVTNAICIAYMVKHKCFRLALLAAHNLWVQPCNAHLKRVHHFWTHSNHLSSVHCFGARITATGTTCDSLYRNMHRVS